ncbi:MAG: long-chain fatty acid--CoA ligase [Pseudomonadota bacterium]
MDLIDVIAPEQAVTLDGLFRERVRRTPHAVAYREYVEDDGCWRDYTWAQMEREVARWQAAFLREGLHAGDRVALMLKNCTAWVAFDQAALGLGLVVVPIYTSDRPDNVAYILNDCTAKMLLFENFGQWQAFEPVRDQLGGLLRIITLRPPGEVADDARLRSAGEWLPDQGGAVRHVTTDPDQLATIIYTSGTTGRPKGVMLSHHNILTNAAACLKVLTVRRDDILLSFLPLSHTFERTAGYYLAVMAGAGMAFARSVTQLAEDLQTIRPTLLISVPRIYERVYGNIRAKLAEAPVLRRKLFELAVTVGWRRFEHQQGRQSWHASLLLWPLLERLVAVKIMARLGGRLRTAISGGAALSPEISRVFIGLGLPILQGYGMTETSPVITANRLDDNLPASVGTPVEGVRVKIGDRDALLMQGPGVMMGYWNNPQATQAMFTADGWLNTGDTARIDAQGHVFITGRLKEIIVMSNGEKIPPLDMETAILRDPLFEQVMVVGEARPYLSVLVVLNPDEWRKVAQQEGIDVAALRSRQAENLILERIARQVREFPGYAQVRRAAVMSEPWTVENGMLTPTLKLKRPKVLEEKAGEIEALYAGH